MQVLVSEDFNVDSIYRKLLILDQIYWSYYALARREGGIKRCFCLFVRPSDRPSRT